jgi:general stress protein 26
LKIKSKKSKDWETVVHGPTTDPKATIWFYSNTDSEVVLQVENSLKVIFSQKYKQ